MLSFLPSNRIQESFFHLLENLKVYNILNGIYESLASQSNAGQTLHSYGNRDVTLQSKHHCFTKPLLFLLLCLLWFTPSGMANNIQIANGEVVQVGADVFIEFDLSWENSWRTSSAPNNWDAAWVFVKFRESGGVWRHAWLSTNDGHHIPGSGTGATINIGTTNIGGTNRGMGAFIYRSGDGTGTFSTTGARLRWEIAAQGLAATTPVEIRIFAIEMVYVAEGDFSVGSGGTEFNSFTQANNTAGATVPFRITSTPPTIQGNDGGSSSSNLGARGSMDITGTTTASLASGFPTGYAAFYCMKYEISQQQYVDFLNTLTRAQQNNRTATNLAEGVTSVNNRYVMSNSFAIQFVNGIRVDAIIHTSNPITFYCDLNGNGTGGEAADGQWIAMNWINWMDGAAYMDWSGLRPFTELEYEKAARGPANPVANEYAWGSTGITAATGISNAGANNETASNAAANAVIDNQGGVQGPLRVGAFAKAGTTRAEAGASYWGIMELSGNLWERPVTVGNADGRNFTGLHGDGALSAAGHATVTAWPGLTSGEVTGASGSGLRGANWFDFPTSLRVSERFLAAGSNGTRNNSLGFRGVRSAPVVGMGG